MREIFSTPQFKGDVKDVESEMRKRINAIIAILRDNPADPSLSAKKLHGVQGSIFRIRIGSYRLVYRFTKTQLILLRFKDRKEIYRKI